MLWYSKVESGRGGPAFEGFVSWALVALEVLLTFRNALQVFTHAFLLEWQRQTEIFGAHQVQILTFLFLLQVGLNSQTLVVLFCRRPLHITALAMYRVRFSPHLQELEIADKFEAFIEEVGKLEHLEFF